jgi:hypothetical protein
MTDQSNMPATLRRLSDIVDEYDQKRAAMQDSIKEFHTAANALESQTVIGGTYVGSIWYGAAPRVQEHTFEANLRKSAWQHVYKGLNLHRIASASDRKKFEAEFENSPAFTLDNLRATFGAYVADPRHHILKGLAECFVGLDPAFKSHSKVKVGVAGLPKRVILPNVAGGYGAYGEERLKDTVNALRVFEGRPHVEYRPFAQWIANAQRDLDEWGPGYLYREGRMIEHDGKVWAAKRDLRKLDAWDADDWTEWQDPEPGLELRVYGNGNGHLIFSKDKLRQINLALAEFYGDVLPDAEGEGDDEAQADRDLFRSREVSTDLQYYPTPQKVIDRVLSSISRGDNGGVILEPSCGDGRMLDTIRKVWPSAKRLGVEIHPGRVEAARAKGHLIYKANFLEMTPVAEHDLIVMNPPFYGKHWKKHLAHARKFLKPRTTQYGQSGGTLICILPGSAFYDGHLDDMGISEAAWTDLPVASFNESGTNIPTGYVVIGAGR